MPVPHIVTKSGKIIPEYTDVGSWNSKPVPVVKSSITVPKVKFNTAEQSESTDNQPTE